MPNIITASSRLRRLLATIATVIFVLLAWSFLANSNNAIAANGIEYISASGSPAAKLENSYKSSELQLELKYPSNWRVQEHPDKDSIFKISGVNGAAVGEIAASATADETMTPENLAHAHEIYIFPHLQDCKVLAHKQVAFGADSKLAGSLVDISFEMNGIPICQREVFFSHAGKTITLNLTSAASQFEELRPMFNDMLLSVRPLSVGATNVRSTPQDAAFSWHLRSLNLGSPPLRLAYPDGWTVSQTGNPDHPLEISGSDNAGHQGMIALFSGELHPLATVDQAVQSIEERHFQSKTSYRLIKSETISFGSSAKLEGIEHESSYQEAGQPVKQYALFFRNKGELNALIFAGFGWKDSEVNNLFHKILASVDTE